VEYFKIVLISINEGVQLSRANTLYYRGHVKVAANSDQRNITDSRLFVIRIVVEIKVDEVDAMHP